MTERETKWTPGPWNLGNSYGAMYDVVSKKEHGICSTGGFTSNIGDIDAIIAENKANAILIAAAPELYAALDELLNDLGNRIVGFDDRRAVRKAEEALSKARGESND